MTPTKPAPTKGKPTDKIDDSSLRGMPKEIAAYRRKLEAEDKARKAQKGK
jgi:hypothetical protein